MGFTRSAKLFAAGALLRSTGSMTAGRALVDALGSEDEDAAMMAGMFLVQGGSRSKPVLREALALRKSLPEVLTILGDLQDPALAPELQRYLADPDPEVARAAQAALDLLLQEPD